MTIPSLPPLKVPALLRKHSLRPQKRLGQNFLVDESALRKIVQIAAVSPEETVLEVGPGVGSLTRHLAAAARNVIAVELDGRLIPPLKEVLEPFSNVTLIEGDILKQNINELLSNLPKASSYAVIANIPYYITSAVVRHLLEADVKPDRMVLTVQREVAERICATPPGLSLLALSVQVYGKPHLAGRIPAGAFYPAPQVDSAILHIDLYPQPFIPSPYLGAFFRLAKSGFAQKRKNLRNALSAGLGLSKTEIEALLQNASIDPRRRAETLTLAEWKTLTSRFLETR